MIIKENMFIIYLLVWIHIFKIFFLSLFFYFGMLTLYFFLNILMNLEYNNLFICWKYTKSFKGNSEIIYHYINYISEIINYISSEIILYTDVSPNCIKCIQHDWINSFGKEGKMIKDRSANTCLLCSSFP